MKKIVMMLLGVAATINVMAVDYTAKATILLEATSGESCELYLYQSNEYSALGGYEMYMTGRKVAFYALNGTTPLQIAQAADLESVKLGLLADASTSYTLTVSSVAGTETLYIWDADSASYALTEGASYTFAAAANATDEARFVIKKAPLPTAKQICFNDEKLQLSKYAGAKVDVYLQGEAAPAKSETVASNALKEIDLSTLAAGEYVVKIDLDGDAAIDEQYRITVKPALSAYTPVVP